MCLVLRVLEYSISIIQLNFTVAKKLSQEMYAIFFLSLTLLLSKLLKVFLKTCTDYFRIVRSDVMALKINCLNSKFIISNLRKGPNFDMDDVKK